MAVIRSGCCDRQAVADRGAVVLDVDGVFGQAELLGELVDHLRQVVEGVGELVVRRHRAVAVAGVVRRDHVILVRQRRDQIAEHLRAGREAVEQEDRRGVLRAGLAVEDVQVADLHGLVVHDRLFGRWRGRPRLVALVIVVLRSRVRGIACPAGWQDETP